MHILLRTSPGTISKNADRNSVLDGGPDTPKALTWTRLVNKLRHVQNFTVRKEMKQNAIVTVLATQKQAYALVRTHGTVLTAVAT